MVPIPTAIIKAMGHSDLQMTMHYDSFGKSHIPTDLDSSDARRECPTQFSLKKTVKFVDNPY
jgi:hypothetical protein